MTIDEARTALGKERKYALHENKQAFDIAIDVMRKYQMMQADYNARLKADMVAMLTELQLKINELDLVDYDYAYTRGAEDTRDYIANMLEEKIDKLKEVKDGNK